ncbi:MAG: zinc-dependent alcohol dehydrogenase family protein [Labilithrix sp.]|nr:zinc-dependent alcohol dehydrogenase family protein [Labilithrix sp.]MCW5835270.1 zinc-dependent alcohol dehydrogenase family protein [Labilithrix sp.]
MKRMVLDAPSPASATPLRLEEAPDPTPGEDELVIAVRACAVCRTDLQLVSGDLPARRLPIVPGHQIVGEVAAVGSGVSTWSVGDRVAAGWLSSACGACVHCLAGRENLCERARFTGWDVDGGYATRAVVKAGFAFAVPAGFDAIDAAPLLCGGVIGYRALGRAGVRPGMRVGLYGFGASALLAMQVARHRGCRVFVATRSTVEQARAREMGAVWAGAYDDEPPEPLDAVVTFAPAGDVVVAALRRTARGGTVAINAIHLDRVPAFSYDLLWWERSLVSVSNYTRQDASELLDLAARLPLRTRFERHPLERANEALLRLRDGLVDGSAVLVM